MKARSKQSNPQRVILAVERLENRITPVLGNGVAPPAAVAAGAVIAVGAPAGELDHASNPWWFPRFEPQEVPALAG